MDSLRGGNMNISARRRKNQICRVLSGTRLDLRKKVKNATKNKAHIAACKGMQK